MSRPLSPAPSPAALLPLPGTGFVVGRGEDPFLGSGWHEREVRQTDQTPYRGVTEWALFRLCPPQDVPPNAPLRLKVLLMASVSLLGEPYRGELYIGEDLADTWTTETENWVIRRTILPCPLPLDADGTLHLALHSRTLWVPAQTIPGNPDQRRIGCYVGAMLLERADDGKSEKQSQD